MPCAFWLVQALAKTGRSTEAAGRFAALIDLATPIGLYAEEMEPTSGSHLGNYPQALTHAALVQAALALRDATAETRSASSGVASRGRDCGLVMARPTAAAFGR